MAFDSHHYKSLLYVTDQFSALVRLIDLLRRDGKLEDCLPYLEQVRQKMKKYLLMIIMMFFI